MGIQSRVMRSMPLFEPALVASTAPTFGDGSETLGIVTIAIGEGRGTIAAGVGLWSGPGTIDIEVPGDVVQAVLCWEGHAAGPTGYHDTIVVDGNTIAGTAWIGAGLSVPVTPSPDECKDDGQRKWGWGDKKNDHDRKDYESSGDSKYTSGKDGDDDCKSTKKDAGWWSWDSKSGCVAITGTSRGRSAGGPWDWGTGFSKEGQMELQHVQVEPVELSRVGG